MISALPVTADSGTPAARLLAMVIRSGTTPKCSIANILPVRPKPVWISSAISTMPCSSHSARSQLHGLGLDHVEAAFALHRLEDDGRDAAGFDVGLEEVLRPPS